MSTINPYSAGIPYIGPNAMGVSEIQYKSTDEYRKMLEELELKFGTSSVDPSLKLYNGSTTRAKLSETEIAVLANKYDVHNMSDKEYNAFLDDLESMGAISNYEKTYELGYMGRTYVGIGATGTMLSAWQTPIDSSGRTPIFERRDANGDISKWINDRIQWKPSYSKDPDQRKAQEDSVKLHNTLAEIINRVDQQRTTVQPRAEDTTLSDTKVAALARKYDPHNMDQDIYDKFLDELESMGVISDLEKRQIGYNGWRVVAYTDENGDLVYTGAVDAHESPRNLDGLSMKCVLPWEAGPDIHKWFGDRVQDWKGTFDPSSKEASEAYGKLLNKVFGVLDRMAVSREEDAEDEAKAELIRQLADENSEFYANMRAQLKAQVERNKEDEEQQAIIDALGAVLDALSGKKDASGNKTSVNKSAADLTQKIGERISKLDPDNPERVRLENMLKRLQEMGIYIDFNGMDDLWQDEDETFETLTQFLIRRQAEETSKTHPIINEVNEPA